MDFCLSFLHWAQCYMAKISYEKVIIWVENVFSYSRKKFNDHVVRGELLCPNSTTSPPFPFPWWVRAFAIVQYHTCLVILFTGNHTTLVVLLVHMFTWVTYSLGWPHISDCALEIIPSFVLPICGIDHIQHLRFLMASYLQSSCL